MLIEARSMWRLSLMALLLVAGCTSRNPKSCLDDFCEDPSLPFCDADGSFSGNPGTCIAVECTPFEFETCRGSEALVCNTGGNGFDITNCDNGCDDATGCIACPPGSPDCQPRITPHFIPSVCDSVSVSAPYAVPASTALDTSDAASCTGGTLVQENGLEVCVIRAPSFRIDAAATLRVKGSRILAVVTDAELAIHGTLDVSADNDRSAGPGGAFRISGTAYDGAGFATAGGRRGGSTATPTGTAIQDPALSNTMVAGATSAGAGAGGGGVVLVSCRGSVRVAGLLDANGGGGPGGFLKLNAKLPGSGGGSGGYVVLQGMTVEVTGRIFANGGGGGAGCQADGSDGAAGQDGPPSATGSPIPNGGGAGNGNGAGGYGGQLLEPPGDGVSPSGTGGAGGGGGSKGFIQIFTPRNVPPITGSATVSPAFQPHRNVETTTPASR